MLTGSGPVVSVVLYSLIAASVGSWGVILFKARQVYAARKGAEEFQKLFWETRNLAEVSRACGQLGDNPLAAVFTAGYEELLRLRTKKKAAADEGLTTELAGIANVERAMRRAAHHERTELEKLLTFLATTSSTTPFIGLFGTVWGIMTSFRGLSAGGPSSIQAVAPGISEALIATAAGLAAAIPALVAYNHYARAARLLAGEMDSFISEFLNIAERHFLN
ncbi:MAG: MotA/TolQ/ExbB proton channel family protein [Deltaproteobacteria bacterium]|nr:MotA/TolQ/ExbB proton channel family protein [Deltaproteobacteria bacterium]